jgi:23S rRNA (guanosine2251-2'-O)-methyltransferase
MPEAGPYTAPTPPKHYKIFGARPVLEALDAGYEIDKVLIKRNMGGDQTRELEGILARRGVQLQRVPEQALNKHTGSDKHQGVVAFVAPILYQPLEETLMTLFDQGENPLLVFPAGVTDVRNLGALARSAGGMGAHAMLLAASGRARVNAEAVKASAGALYHLPVCRLAHVQPSLEYLQASGVTIIGCYEAGQQRLWNASLQGPTCLLLGGESEGIPKEWLAYCDQTARIPMAGTGVASLNVSAAAAMLFYEALRQREQT